MFQGHRLSIRSLLAAALVVVAAGGLARAQDEDEPEKAPQPVQVQILNENNIDQWVFNNGRNNAATARGRLESLLKLQVADVGRTCGVTETQEKKLELAGRGDIKRFFDRIEEIKRKHTPLKNDPNVINAVFQEIQPLRAAVNSGPFGEGSLFFKTIRKTLNEEQAARYERMLRDRRRFRFQAMIELSVKQFDHSLGLSAEQRERFSKLLLTETRPSKVSGPYDYYVILLQAAKLPENKIKPIFDDAQWRLLNQQFDQMKGNNINQFLERNGYVPDDDAAEPGAK